MVAALQAGRRVDRAEVDEHDAGESRASNG
jgi:hypothetical protein